MPRWIVGVRETRVRDVEVEASNYDAAVLAGEEAGAGASGHVTATPIRQLGEPWVTGGWYDLHGPSDVAVFNPSHGNLFTEADVAGLRGRLEKLGLAIVDSWNGAGRSTVSFKCGGRRGGDKFTKAQLATLLAPRDWEG